MKEGKGIRKMSKAEILELLRRKHWSRLELAQAIGVKENIVQRWLMQIPDRTPGAAASELMRLWLREARGEIKIVEVKRPATIAAVPLMAGEAVTS